MGKTTTSPFWYSLIRCEIQWKLQARAIERGLPKQRFISDREERNVSNGSAEADKSFVAIRGTIHNNRDTSLKGFGNTLRGGEHIEGGDGLLLHPGVDTSGISSTTVLSGLVRVFLTFEACKSVCLFGDERKSHVRIPEESGISADFKSLAKGLVLSHIDLAKLNRGAFSLQLQSCLRVMRSEALAVAAPWSLQYGESLFIQQGLSTYIELNKSKLLRLEPLIKVINGKDKHSLILSCLSGCSCDQRNEYG